MTTDDYSHSLSLGVEAGKLLNIQLAVTVTIEFLQQHDDLGGLGEHFAHRHWWSDSEDLPRSRCHDDLGRREVERGVL